MGQYQVGGQCVGVVLPSFLIPAFSFYSQPLLNLSVIGFAKPLFLFFIVSMCVSCFMWLNKSKYLVGQSEVKVCRIEMMDRLECSICVKTVLMYILCTWGWAEKSQIRSRNKSSCAVHTLVSERFSQL